MRPLDWLIDIAEIELLRRLSEGERLRLCPREMAEDQYDLFVGTRKAFIAEEMAMERMAEKGWVEEIAMADGALHMILTSEGHVQFAM